MKERTNRAKRKRDGGEEDRDKVKEKRSWVHVGRGRHE